MVSYFLAKITCCNLLFVTCNCLKCQWNEWNEILFYLAEASFVNTYINSSLQIINTFKYKFLCNKLIIFIEIHIKYLYEIFIYYYLLSWQ
jgi:hypothetical protein